MRHLILGLLLNVLLINGSMATKPLVFDQVRLQSDFEFLSRVNTLTNRDICSRLVEVTADTHNSQRLSLIRFLAKKHMSHIHVPEDFFIGLFVMDICLKSGVQKHLVNGKWRTMEDGQLVLEALLQQDLDKADYMNLLTMALGDNKAMRFFADNFEMIELNKSGLDQQDVQYKSKLLDHLVESAKFAAEQIMVVLNRSYLTTYAKYCEQWDPAQRKLEDARRGFQINTNIGFTVKAVHEQVGNLVWDDILGEYTAHQRLLWITLAQQLVPNYPPERVFSACMVKSLVPIAEKVSFKALDAAIHSIFLVNEGDFILNFDKKTRNEVLDKVFSVFERYYLFKESCFSQFAHRRGLSIADAPADFFARGLIIRLKPKAIGPEVIIGDIAGINRAALTQQFEQLGVTNYNLLGIIKDTILMIGMEEYLSTCERTLVKSHHSEETQENFLQAYPGQIDALKEGSQRIISVLDGHITSNNQFWPLIAVCVKRDQASKITRFDLGGSSGFDSPVKITAAFLEMPVWGQVASFYMRKRSVHIASDIVMPGFSDVLDEASQAKQGPVKVQQPMVIVMGKPKTAEEERLIARREGLRKKYEKMQAAKNDPVVSVAPKPVEVSVKAKKKKKKGNKAVATVVETASITSDKTTTPKAEPVVQNAVVVEEEKPMPDSEQAEKESFLIARLAEPLLEVKRELDEANAQLAKTERSLAGARAELKVEKQKTLEKAEQLEAKDKQIGSLEKAAKAAQDTVREVRGQLKAAKKQEETLNAQLAEAKALQEKTQVNLLNLKRIKDELAEGKKGIEKEKDELAAQSKKQAADKVKLEASAKTLSADNERLAGQIRGLEGKLESAQSTSGRLQKQLDDTMAAVAKLKNDLAAEEKEKAKLAGQVKSAEERLLESKTKLEEYEQTSKAQLAEIEQLKAANAKLTEQPKIDQTQTGLLDFYKKDNAMLASNNDKLSAENRRLEAVMQEGNAEFQRQMALMAWERDSAIAQVVPLQLQVLDVQRQLGEKDERIAELKLLLTALQKQQEEKK
jgi:hypothetical protein